MRSAFDLAVPAPGKADTITWRPRGDPRDPGRDRGASTTASPTPLGLPSQGSTQDPASRHTPLLMESGGRPFGGDITNLMFVGIALRLCFLKRILPFRDTKTCTGEKMIRLVLLQNNRGVNETSGVRCWTTIELLGDGEEYMEIQCAHRSVYLSIHVTFSIVRA